MIALAGGLIPLVLFYLVVRPGFMGDSLFPPRFLGLNLDEVSLIVGLAGMAFGLAWTIQIHRADPEPGERAWRYRDF
jgi:hypothetical protein